MRTQSRTMMYSAAQFPRWAFLLSYRWLGSFDYCSPSPMILFPEFLLCYLNKTRFAVGEHSVCPDCKFGIRLGSRLSKAVLWFFPIADLILSPHFNMRHFCKSRWVGFTEARMWYKRICVFIYNGFLYLRNSIPRRKLRFKGRRSCTAPTIRILMLTVLTLTLARCLCSPSSSVQDFPITFWRFSPLIFFRERH